MVMVSIYRSDLGLSTQGVMDPEMPISKIVSYLKNCHMLKKQQSMPDMLFWGRVGISAPMKDKDNQKKKVEEESRSQNEPWHVQVI